MEYFTLRNGLQIPAVGFGTYKATEGEQSDAIRIAMEEGYRYFDTASFYETEEAVAQALKDSGLDRKEVMIATKAWKTEMGYEEVQKAFYKSLERLEMDYIDVYLIHWPLRSPEDEDWKRVNAETWKALEELYQEGKVRAIGLSNFLPHHIENLLQTCRVAPMLNQLELHPGHMQEAAVRYCLEKGIALQAYRPVGRGQIFEDVLLKKLAEKYGVSIPKLCLRYEYQRGVASVPKASAREKMRDNLSIFDFEISEMDMHRIDGMPPLGWSGEHPDRERVYFGGVKK